MGYTIIYPADATDRRFATITGFYGQRISKEIQIVIPDCTNTVTFTFTIWDENSRLRYSIGGLAKNTTPLLLVERIIKPDYTVGMQASGAPGSALSILINPEYY